MRSLMMDISMYEKLCSTKHMMSIEEVGFSISKREDADVAFRARPLIEFIESSDGTIPGSGTDRGRAARIGGQWRKSPTLGPMIDDKVGPCRFPDGGIPLLLEKAA